MMKESVPATVKVLEFFSHANDLGWRFLHDITYNLRTSRGCPDVCNLSLSVPHWQVIVETHNYCNMYYTSRNKLVKA